MSIEPNAQNPVPTPDSVPTLTRVNTARQEYDRLMGEAKQTFDRLTAQNAAARVAHRRKPQQP